MRKFRKSYQLKLTDEQLRDLLFVCDRVMLVDADDFKERRGEGENVESHIYQKAVKSLAILENII